MPDNPTKNPQNPQQKSRLFFTLQPEKRIAKWLLGTSSIQRTGSAVRHFHDAMLHGDEQHREWMENVSAEDRELLANRVRREGLLYAGMGALFSVGAFVDGIHHGLRGQIPAGAFWLILGMLSGFMGGWLATVKLWQAYNVRHAAHVGLKDFLKIRPHGDH